MADHYMVKLMPMRSCGTMLTFEVRPFHRQTTQMAVAEALEQMFGMTFVPEGDNYLRSGLRIRYYYEATEVQA